MRSRRSTWQIANRPSTWQIALGIVGKLLLSMSVGVLLFLAWTLWGTQAAADREQKNLSRSFDQLPTVYRVTPGSDREPLLPPEDFRPKIGDPIFRLRIPKMHLNEIVVEGVAPAQLDVAPGHYPSCRKGVERSLCTPWEAPFPGEPGRVIVSGHRTTYGKPFWDLNLLREGDEIITETKWGTFTYEVIDRKIVPADSTRIVIPSARADLVLTTCHPRYSAAQRLVVQSRLVEAEPPS